MTLKELGERRKLFMDNNLCFNCGRSGHRAHHYTKSDAA